jgi:GT2 family glycosyltransferase
METTLTSQIPARAAAKMLEVELSEPIAPVSLRASGDARLYSRALCLVRLHHRPLGLVWLEPRGPNAEGGQDLAAPAVAQLIWDELADRIREHLHADGLPLVESLPPEGLRAPARLMCGVERDAIRAQAPPATVVVATRERPESLARCLRSLLGLVYPEYEIVVVDNAPQTFRTRELLGSDSFRTRVKYVREDRPGLAAAHNRGLAEAAGTIVAFTDDDVTVDRLWLIELARGFRLAERVGCVTGLIVPAELETSAQVIAEELWGWSKGFAERVFDLTTNGGDPLYPYTAGTFGSGANMAFDASALRALGGFDPAIGAGTLARGGDDLSAFFSVVSAGHRLVYNPSAFVRHAHHADYEALKRQAHGYGVGLTAYLTKTVLDRPGRVLELGLLSRAGLARARAPRAATHSFAGDANRRSGPADLAWAERWGMVCGPAAYLRSRRRVRREVSASTGSGHAH